MHYSSLFPLLCMHLFYNHKGKSTHFFSFDSEGEQQAVNYIQTVGKLEGKMIPVVDVEYYGDETYIDRNVYCADKDQFQKTMVVAQ